MSDKIILIDSEEAAKLKDLSLWVSRTGNVFSDERAARYDGCTHVKCQLCGNPCKKHFLRCEDCRAIQDREKFMTFPEVAWDEKTPICTFRSDSYFFSEDELEDYCEENEIKREDLMLVLCEQVRPRFLDAEFFDDCLADEEELPKELLQAIDEFNAKVAAYPHPLSWVPGKQRIVFAKSE
jgi:hypothetical protein